MKPLLNAKTALALAVFSKKPSHALLLTAQESTGLDQITDYFLDLLAKTQSLKPQITRIVPDEKGTIGVETIRDLRSVLKLRNTTTQSISKVIIVEPIDAVTTQGQSALLKVLEEPVYGVLFVLQSYKQQMVLETINSRCVRIAILPVSLLEATEYFGYNNSDLPKNYLMSQGNAGLLMQLMSDNGHESVQQINDAKILLAKPLFDKLAAVDLQYKKRIDVEILLVSLERLCSAAMRHGLQTQKWINNTKAVLSAQKCLQANVQPKLVLDQLFISFG